MEATRSRKKDRWADNFSLVKPWSPQMVAKRRRVWVKLLGVPLHVWEERCFKDMENFIGEFIDFDIVNAERKRLDEVRLLIYTKQFGFINKKIFLKVVGEMFEVWRRRTFQWSQNLEGVRRS